MLHRISLPLLILSSFFVSCNQPSTVNQAEKDKAAKYDSIINVSKQTNIETKNESSLATKIYNDCILSVVTVVSDNQSLGSGFFVLPNIIATNYHVIKGCHSAKIKLSDSGELFDVIGFVGVDIPNDIILLQCKGVERGALTISNDVAETGEQVFVIGSPFGLEASFSNGIISSIRTIGSKKLIQLNAAISPGNSGGPVINGSKEVVGIAVMQLSEGQNLNFAVPIQYLNTLIAFKDNYPSEFENLASLDPTYFNEKNNFALSSSEENNVSNEYQDYNGTYLFKTSFNNPAIEPPLHIEPNVNSSEVYKCPINSTVFVIDNKAVNDIWFKVYVNGFTGYVSKGFLRRQW